MGVARVRNQNDDGWIVIGGGVEVVQQDSEPAETYPGMLWLDTDAVVTVPAFQATLSGDQSNLTTGTANTIQFDTVTFDSHNDFDTTNYKFICPETGIYHFDLILRFQGVDASYDYVYVTIWTTQGAYQCRFDPGVWTGDTDFWSWTQSVLVPMDENDEALIYVRPQGGAAQMDVLSAYSFFCGYKVG